MEAKPRADAANIMSTKQKEEAAIDALIALALHPRSAELTAKVNEILDGKLARKWSVSFRTKDGKYHPIRLQYPNLTSRDKAKDDAIEYRNENASWLLDIDDIYPAPTEDPSLRKAEPAADGGTARTATCPKSCVTLTEGEAKP